MFILLYYYICLYYYIIITVYIKDVNYYINIYIIMI